MFQNLLWGMTHYCWEQQLMIPHLPHCWWCIIIRSGKQHLFLSDFTSLVLGAVSVSSVPVLSLDSYSCASSQDMPVSFKFQILSYCIDLYSLCFVVLTFQCMTCFVCLTSRLAQTISVFFTFQFLQCCLFLISSFGVDFVWLCLFNFAYHQLTARMLQEV